MALPVSAFVALDLVGASLALVVAGFFAFTWRRSGSALHLLFAVGFGLVGLGISAVSTSAFDLVREPDAWDALRIAGHTAGSLVLAFAYLSARRHGAARPLQVLGWTVAVAGLFLASLYWGLPPQTELPSLGDAFTAAHTVQFLAYLGCFVLSLEGFRRAPRLENALVPAAFLAWVFSKYTWLFIDIQGGTTFIPLVYLWRFAALGLLLAALTLPARVREGSSAAP